MDREDLFLIFKKAIEDEEKARDFYLRAAGSVSDPDIKKTFEELARTEIGHAELLRDKYRELVERGE
ncbi:MAG: hypothetical protein Kow0025_16260 [Thermodesulfovibrionales bacterium]